MTLVVDTDLAGTASATFSECRTYRYVLTRTWSKGQALAWIMLNPSTADALADDPTIRRCKQFARDMGYSGITVVNLFALRSPDPKALRGHSDPIGPHNNAAIHGACGGVVVAAWGTHGGLLNRDEAVAADLRERGVRLYCLGMTSAGAPRHPLYVRGDADLIPYAADLSRKRGADGS